MYLKRRKSKSRRVAASRKIKENVPPLSRLLISGSSPIVYLRVPSVVSRAVPGRRFSRRTRVSRESPRTRDTKTPKTREIGFRFLRTTRIIHPTIIHNVMNDNDSSLFHRTYLGSSFSSRHPREYLPRRRPSWSSSCLYLTFQRPFISFAPLIFLSVSR